MPFVFAEDTKHTRVLATNHRNLTFKSAFDTLLLLNPHPCIAPFICASCVYTRISHTKTLHVSFGRCNVEREQTNRFLAINPISRKWKRTKLPFHLWYLRIYMRNSFFKPHKMPIAMMGCNSWPGVGNGAYHKHPAPLGGWYIDSINTMTLLCELGIFVYLFEWLNV